MLERVYGYKSGKEWQVSGHEQVATGIATLMRAVRLNGRNGAGDVSLEEIDKPSPRAGEALVRVHAAAITRGELEWTLDRLPAVPSYELSGVVVSVASDVDGVSIGDPVYALTGFDRDGVAAEYAVVPAGALAPKPRTLDHVASAAVPLAALSAWQGLFDHGDLQPGHRVLISGAAGGVGHFATQLARWRGAYVIGTSSSRNADFVRDLGAHEVLDHTSGSLDDLDRVHLFFDTVGGEQLVRSSAFVHEGGRLVSVAEEPPEISGATNVDTLYFVVEPNRAQLVQLARLLDAGDLHPAVDSVFPLAEARSAFERSMAPGKRGKVVLQVVGD